MYWREHPMRIAALEKVRYSCCLSPITGSAALRKSSFLFFLSFLASSAQLTEQYFCIPLLDVNVLPQNAHFLVFFILSLILMFYTLFCVFHRGVNGSQLLPLVVNLFNLCDDFRILPSLLSLSVNRCQPLSPDLNFVAKIKPRTFTAIEIRHKIIRKMSKHQKLTVKC